jgi:hypothetical protein
MMTRLGKENVVQVGWAAVGAALLGVLGRNVNGFLCSFDAGNKEMKE